jgi:hypothetical protein
MKQLLMAAACAALLATPALAQSAYDQADNPQPAAGGSRDCATLPDSARDQPCPANLSSGQPGDSQAPFSLAAAQMTGTIMSVDSQAGTITLDDGKTYGLPTSVAFNDLAVGKRVTIAFADLNGKLMASDVRPVDAVVPADDAGKPDTPSAY